MIDNRLLLTDLQHEGVPELRVDIFRERRYGSISKSSKDAAFVVPTREANVDGRRKRQKGTIAGLFPKLE